MTQLPTKTELRVMQALQDGIPKRAWFIAKNLGLAKNSVYAFVRFLEKKGYIFRKKVCDDPRGVKSQPFWALTTKGRRLLRGING